MTMKIFFGFFVVFLFVHSAVAYTYTNETLDGASMLITFTTVPNFNVRFKDSTGAFLPDYNVTYTWESLLEVDNSTGTAIEGGKLVIIQNLAITDPSLVWTQSVYVDKASGWKNVNFSTTFPSGTFLEFSYFYFSNPQTINYPYINLTRTLPPDSFKFSLALRNWAPVNESNLFCVKLHDVGSPYFHTVNHTLSDYVWHAFIGVGQSVLQLFNLISVALTTKGPLQLAWYAEYDDIFFTPDISTHGFTLFFYFPNFNDSLFYDPDLSVVVNGGASGSGFGDGGDGTNSNLVAIIVPSVLVPVALIVIVVVIVAGVVISYLVSKRRKLSRQVRLSEGQRAASQEDEPI